MAWRVKALGVRRGQLKAGTGVWACVAEMEVRELRRDGRGSLRRGGEEASKRGPRVSGEARSARLSGEGVLG